MIGLGSPADTMRESDVIVLMVSPLLALTFVIDHNTEQRTEFPRVHHDRAWIGWKRPIEQALPILAANRCERRILERRPNEIVGDCEPPPVDVSRLLRPSQGCRRSPAQTHPASGALL